MRLLASHRSSTIMRPLVVAVMLTSALGLSLESAATHAQAKCFGRAVTILGTSKGETLVGTRGPDVIAARGGTDQVYGLGGDDFICAGAGYRAERDEDTGGTIAFGDYVEAGAGDDHVKGGRHYDRIVGDTLPSSESGDRRGRHGSDALFGGLGRSDILGQGGDDLIRGGAMVDDFDAGVGDDVMRGFAGGDLVSGARGNDRIYGGRGDDEILPAQGDDRVVAGAGTDLLNLYWTSCGSGCLSAHGLDLWVRLHRRSARGMGRDRVRGIEDVWGGNGSDRIIGNHRANVLGAQDDQGPGRDSNVLRGRGGDDRLVSGRGDDDIHGGEGRDTLAFTLNDCPVTIDLRRHRVIGCGTDAIHGIENADGSGGDDTLIGNGVDNVFRGGYGSDRIIGGRGEDELYGQELRDVLEGRGGDDRLDGGSGSNVNDGGVGFDTCLNPDRAGGAVACEA